MNLYDVAKMFVVAFIVGIFGWPDDDDLKPERIQFWKKLIDPAWKHEGRGVALLRTIICTSAGDAGDLAKMLAGELARCGYEADALDTAGTVVSLRLTTATVGELTERDYAAAALIDLVM